ncbi:cation diffusion facilitator family transporter [Mycolicibacterium arseniciresistens]|uniref:Cation transporter n=1 Tax=Mycolicibacterium arseniciresistens TaxID=3062257 RepID=A0ABT8UHE3_9MYCO|nr:hypothetical protein [Mycolicibacterium arseniciresistens]MDO3637224.1 hypothetical protein [Mycolicibacterium arseniciresistens]
MPSASGRGRRVAMTRPREDQLVRRGLALAWFIVVWDVIEGIIAVTAGLAANSIALVGFGIDSTIEVFAASVVIWQLRGGAHAREAPALRMIAITFFALAGYVSFESVRDLIGREAPGESLIGIVLNVIALIVMIPVALAQRRTGQQLNNPVLVAQSTETWMSNALSVTVLAGLGFNSRARVVVG